MIRTKLLSQLILVALGTTSVLSAQPPQLGKDSVKEVIQAMTLEEKAGLVVGTGMRMPGLPAQMQGTGVGEIKDKVPGAAGSTLAIPRLGIPSIVVADGPAGLRIQPKREGDETTYYCTAFPIATLLASSWDVALVEKVGSAVGAELKDYGVDVLLAPALNIHRIPLGGRNFEYYSEDPLISGKMAAAMTKGVQSQGVGVSLKHYAANNHEWNRNSINVKASQRTLREIYLRGFEIAVRESRPWTVMSSYNKINGTYASESSDLLTSILREDWDFDGLVMTDWFGGKDAVAQIGAQNDLLMPGTAPQKEAIIKAVQEKKLDEAVLDRSVENTLNLILRSPSFKGYQYSNKPALQDHAAIARAAAAEGMVLLKNASGALPLQPGARLALFGNGSYRMITGGTGSGDVNEAYSISLMEGLKAQGFSPTEMLASTYSTFIAEEEAKLPKPNNPFMLPPPLPERPVPIDEISRTAAETDLAIVTISRRSGEFQDRKEEGDFYLVETEKQLLRDVYAVYHSAGKHVVVVLNIGGVIETASWRDIPDSILLAWQPGQEAGHAIADVLSGKVNPSGKLATTFPLDIQDFASYDGFPGTELKGRDPDAPWFRGAEAAEVYYNDGIWVGYRFFNTKKMKVAYPFGFGLSYSEFELSDLKLSGTEFQGSMTATVTVTNRGSLAGKEVVQLYLTAPGKAMAKPAGELKAFAKTKRLQPGESQVVELGLSPRDLASFDGASSAWVIEAGEYTVSVGASSRDIRQTAQFSKAADEKIETTANALPPEVAVAEITVGP